MATKYAMVTYGIPDSEPVLAELKMSGGEIKVLGHGYLWKLIEVGVKVEPLILATPERIEAIEMLLDNSVSAPWLDYTYGGMYEASLTALRAMLTEMRGGNDV